MITALLGWLTGGVLDRLLATVDRTVAGAATMTANTGVTIIGAAVVAAGTSARWNLRRVSSSTYVANRLS